MQCDEFIFMKIMNLVTEDASIFIHNILENLSLLILYQIQIVHWNGLTQGAISLWIQTRLLPFQIILRYKIILHTVPNHGLQCNTAKERYNFYCLLLQAFPREAAHTSDPDIFHSWFWIHATIVWEILQGPFTQGELGKDSKYVVPIPYPSGLWLFQMEGSY